MYWGSNLPKNFNDSHVSDLLALCAVSNMSALLGSARSELYKHAPSQSHRA